MAHRRADVVLGAGAELRAELSVRADPYRPCALSADHADLRAAADRALHWDRRLRLGDPARQWRAAV